MTIGFLIGVSLFAAGCGGSSNGGNGDGGEIDVGTELYTLSQPLKDSITYMYNEERLAKDVYLAIYEVRPVKQLSNIATNSETKHISAVDALAVKYDLNVTLYPDTDVPYSKVDMDKFDAGHYPVEHVQELYDLLYEKGIKSEQDALEVGCMVEVVDIQDLDGYIKEAQDSNAPDVESVFASLRKGSYSHYSAFDSGLKNMGVSTGCCAVESALGYDFCQPSYLK